jgi:hypothetical protein
MNEFINPYLEFLEFFYIYERHQLIRRKKEVKKYLTLFKKNT